REKRGKIGEAHLRRLGDIGKRKFPPATGSSETQGSVDDFLFRIELAGHRHSPARNHRRSIGPWRAYLPSSRARSRAASAARRISGESPPSPINTSSAAAVVPPGEVTLTRSSDAGSSRR